MIPLSLRLSLVIALVLLLAVLATSTLNVLKFQQVMEEFEESRYSFVARDIANVLEQSLNLGLPLDQIDNAQQAIERQLVLDPGIASIVLFDVEGDVLFQASRLPEERTRSILVGDQWTGDLDGEFFTSTQIENNFGQVVGGILVRHSAIVRAQRNETIIRVLSVAALGAAAVGILIVWFGSSQLLKPLRRRLAKTTRILDKIGRANALAAGEGSRFETLANSVLSDLRQAEREVDAACADAAGAGERAEARDAK
ncbi:MAG: hypothetical protein AAF414_03305 [Pseudomonadota bacterium]